MADPAVEASLINGADLRKQDGGVLFQPGHAMGNMHIDRIMLREALRGEGGDNYSRRDVVADIVLNYHDRAAAGLL